MVVPPGILTDHTSKKPTGTNYILTVQSVADDGKECPWTISLWVPTEKQAQFEQKFRVGRILDLRHAELFLNQGKFPSIKTQYVPGKCRILLAVQPREELDGTDTRE